MRIYVEKTVHNLYVILIDDHKSTNALLNMSNLSPWDVYELMMKEYNAVSMLCYGEDYDIACARLFWKNKQDAENAKEWYEALAVQLVLEKGNINNYMYNDINYNACRINERC